MSAITPEQLDALTAKFHTLGAQIEALTAEQETIKALIRDAYPDGADLTAPNGTKVSVFRTRRFDAALAATVIPADVLPRVQATVVDGKLAKAVLPPALYEQCQKEAGKATVRIA